MLILNAGKKMLYIYMRVCVCLFVRVHLYAFMCKRLNICLHALIPILSIPFCLLLKTRALITSFKLISFHILNIPRALMMGITQLFVLSTRTMQWFEERGKHVHTYSHSDTILCDLSVLFSPVLTCLVLPCPVLS